MANETDLPDFDDVEMESPMEEIHADPRDEEIIVLKEEAAALKDRLLRLAAEMENLRKRTEREKAEATLYAATNFARDLLSVSDNLGRALQALPEEERERAGEVEKNLIAGVEVTERELNNVFQRHGIRKIEAVGAKFDPNFHRKAARHRDAGIANGLCGGRTLPAAFTGWRVEGRVTGFQQDCPICN
jgi:molecular chaperone GrpE